MITWGHDYVRLSVDARGRVQRVASLTPSAGVGSALRDAVRGWSFSPAREAGDSVPAEVLVAGLFRPATLHDPPGLDAPSGTVRSEGREIPIPVVTPVPPYPVNAVGDGVALIEVDVNQQGTVSTARIVTATPGFAGSALGAARRWQLQPALRHGRPVPSVAYLVFSFRARSSVGRSESNLTLGFGPALLLAPRSLLLPVGPRHSFAWAATLLVPVRLLAEPPVCDRAPSRQASRIGSPAPRGAVRRASTEAAADSRCHGQG